MTDELDTLSDEKLSEVFALEVGAIVPSSLSVKTPPDPALSGVMDKYGKFYYGAPSFAADLNAVLPYLRDYSLKERPEREYFLLRFPLCVEQGWVCELWCDHHDGAFCEQLTAAPTPARACCIALIRAHRLSP